MLDEPSTWYWYGGEIYLDYYWHANSANESMKFLLKVEINIINHYYKKLFKLWHIFKDIPKVILKSLMNSVWDSWFEVKPRV